MTRRRWQTPPGYSEPDTSVGPVLADIKCIVDEVGVVSSPFGERVVVIAIGTKGERVGVVLDNDDVEAIARCGAVMRASVKSDA